MLNFNKSKALKRANFPQPKPEFGQIWFLVDGSPFVVGGNVIWNKEIEKVIGLFPNGETLGKFDPNRFGDDLIYSPTAPDILSEISKRSNYSDEYPVEYLLRKRGKFWFLDTMAFLETNSIGQNEKSAEACAEAYLSFSSIS